MYRGFFYNLESIYNQEDFDVLVAKYSQTDFLSKIHYSLEDLVYKVIYYPSTWSVAEGSLRLSKLAKYGTHELAQEFIKDADSLMPRDRSYDFEDAVKNAIGRAFGEEALEYIRFEAWKYQHGSMYKRPEKMYIYEKEGGNGLFFDRHPASKSYLTELFSFIYQDGRESEIRSILAKCFADKMSIQEADHIFLKATEFGEIAMFEIWQVIKDKISDEAIYKLINGVESKVDKWYGSSGVFVNLVKSMGDRIPNEIIDDIYSKAFHNGLQAEGLLKAVIEARQNNQTQSAAIFRAWAAVPIEISDAAINHVISNSVLSDGEFFLAVYKFAKDRITTEAINNAFKGLRDFGTDVSMLGRIYEVVSERLSDQGVQNAFVSASDRGAVKVVTKLYEVASERLSDKSISDAFVAASKRGGGEVVNKLYELASERLPDQAVCDALIAALWLRYDEVAIKIYDIASERLSDQNISDVFIYASQRGSVEVITKLYELEGSNIPDIVFIKAFNDAAIRNKNFVASKLFELASNKFTNEMLNTLFYQVCKAADVTMAAKVWEFADGNIEHKNIMDILKLSVGDYRKKELLKKIFEVAGDKLSANNHQEIFNDQLIKGNFDAAYNFENLLNDFTLHTKIDVLEIMVSSILIGLEKSVEPNKYQAFSHLFAKAGIELPAHYQDKLNEVKDNKNPNDFEFINGLAHKLAKYYLTLNQAGDNSLMDAMIDLDNDLALEMLTINGIMPTPFEEDTIVYRGMHININESEIEQLFSNGLRSFSNHDGQKLLGYYVNREWNHVGGNGWNYGGTYVTLDPTIAAKYAVECVQFTTTGATTCGGSMDMNSNEKRLVFEIKLPKGSPKIFGAHASEKEYVPSYISGKDIIAVYEVDEVPQYNGRIAKIYKNPNVAEEPMFKIGEPTRADPQHYYFENSPFHNKRLVFENLEDFDKRYTKERFAADQAKLKETYFSDRPSYTELGLEDAVVGDCNVDYYCC